MDTYPIDMSIYEGMKSVDHHFLGVSPQELLRCYKEEGSGIFYLGFKGCGVCQSMTQYVEEAGEKLDKVIYYLDCTSTEYPFKGDIYDEYVSTFEAYLMTNESGVKTVYTPQLMIIKDGKVIDSNIGGFRGFEDEIVEAYEEMMAKLD